MLKRLALLAVMATLAACTSSGPPTFSRPTADEIGPVLDNYGEAVIPAHGTIVVQGDDLVYGTAIRGGRPGINGSGVRRASPTITEAMRQVLRTDHIVNRGFPGDSIVAGGARWAGEPVGNVLILSYGFGDARAKTPVELYTRTLREMIRHAHAEGAAVFVIPSPSVTDRRLNPALAPYQIAAQTVAIAEGAEVFQPLTEMARVKTTPAKGVAQTPLIYRAIAGGLVPYIASVPAGPRR